MNEMWKPTSFKLKGGIKAVMWTDAFQIIIVLISLSIAAIIGTHNAGGVQKVIEICSDGGRIQFFKWVPFINAIITKLYPWHALNFTFSINTQFWSGSPSATYILECHYRRLFHLGWCLWMWSDSNPKILVLPNFATCTKVWN